MHTCIHRESLTSQISDEAEDKIKALDEDYEWIINMHLNPYDESVSIVDMSNNTPFQFSQLSKETILQPHHRN